jgi:hypothetical protein
VSSENFDFYRIHALNSCFGVFGSFLCPDQLYVTNTPMNFGTICLNSNFYLISVLRIIASEKNIKEMNLNKSV